MSSSWAHYPSKGYKTVNQLTMEEDTPIDLNAFKKIDECVHISTEGSQVVQFYKGKSVLITGGLGFLGKLIIEKLLRTCKDIKKMYLIVRPKGKKNATTRIQEALRNTLFSELQKVHPKFEEKLIVIEGDLSQPGLGISKEDRQMLEDNVNIVIHTAASVKLDEKLRFAAGINIRGTNEIVNLVQNCKNLSSFVYVSSAYSNCAHREIEEQIYFTPYSADDILKLVETQGEKLDGKDQWILGRWPNTYVFSQAISETTVTKQCTGLPACIFRPGVISSTTKEPLKGWINNYSGAVGILAYIQKGILRCLNSNPEKVIEIVPGDYVANGIIVAAYNNQFNKSTNMKIYNFVSSPENPISQNDFFGLAQYYGSETPTSQSIWYPYSTYVENYYMYYFFSFLLHILPALFQDSISVILGTKPKMLHMYKNIHQFTKASLQ
ncbi:hypothetical protein HHI36_014248 [Cryptolaemus montrouzieri]|uniref:Fatty acyl-CoA reductase n=1 Tax=Cryptolaemus montrouzieri TaxID=559131 RepID=A0ABD2N275_9CUCU